jgi:hypothetical protein
MFSQRDDYLSIGCKIIAEEDKTKVSSLKWGSEIICHFNLKGGNQKGIGSDSSDEEYDEEKENSQSEEMNEEAEYELKKISQKNMNIMIYYFEMNI